LTKFVIREMREPPKWFANMCGNTGCTYHPCNGCDADESDCSNCTINDSFECDVIKKEENAQ
jgi:hypothetical protein